MGRSPQKDGWLMALFINRDSFALGRKVSSSSAQVGARADWITPAIGLFQPVRPTGDSVQVANSVNIVTAGLLEKPGPVFSRAINEHFVPVAQLAFREWPVSTGLSKSQLFTEISTTKSTISAKLINRAPYASGIRNGDTARDLVFEPGLEASRLIARDVAKGIAS